MENNNSVEAEKELPVKVKTKKSLFKKIAIVVVLLALPLLAFFVGYWQKNSHAPVNLATESKYASLPVMKEADLAPFDGTDPTKPVYIGLNGLVYDVSAGRSFYDVNGSYHYLAGKDSSTDLNMIGGDIIARKYPVIATLSK
jgi:predicted heme/steroid binding protein